MIIAVDAMGGDFAPEQIVKGACQAISDRLVDKIILVGDEQQILKHADDSTMSHVEIVHTDESIFMDEHPATAYRKKKNASITLATRLVKEGRADAVVSAGSTGAQMVAALFELGRIKGIKRPAIGVLLPTFSGYKLLVDAGANTDVDPENLLQFATMGNIYMSFIKKGTPNIAIINNGTEETKGNQLTQKAYALFSEQDLFHFIGHIEGRDIMSGEADVLVCDGFTGNIVLKVLEGFGLSIFEGLKKEVGGSLQYRLGGLLLKPALRNMKNKLDPKKVGGAPLLGVHGISVVCHGNSDAEALYHGIGVAKECVQHRLIDKIADVINQS